MNPPKIMLAGPPTGSHPCDPERLVPRLREDEPEEELDEERDEEPDDPDAEPDPLDPLPLEDELPEYELPPPGRADTCMGSQARRAAPRSSRARISVFT
jgi:hypothetical protein